MRAALIAPEPPYPMHGGGQIRTASLYAWLQRNYQTKLVQFREGDSEEAPDLVTISLRPHSRSIPARAGRNLRRLIRGVAPLNDRFAGYEQQVAAALGDGPYDLVIVEHLWAAHYLPVIRRVARRVVLDLHNIESALLAGMGATSTGFKGLAYRRFAQSASRDECRWIGQYDIVLVASESDAARLPPGSRVLVYPNALPERPAPAPALRSRSLVFSGNFEYGPNDSGARWFARCVWPGLREKIPDLTWRLVGRGSAHLRTALAGDPRIRFTGEIEDAVASLAESQVAIVPLLAGSGTRLKILEAWQAGLPVVSTTLGAEGFSTEGILRGDSPRQFADCVIHLLVNTEFRAEIAAAGRRLLNDCYLWPVVWRVLDQMTVT